MRRLLLTLPLLATPALADPGSATVGSANEPPRGGEPATVTPAPAPKPAPVAAPRPDQASGIVVEDEPTTSERARMIPRALLFFPKLIVWGAMQPIRGGTYVYERYNLGQKFIDATFTDDGRFGVYPVAGYETTYGFTVGARVLYKDILGEGERIKLRANYGGEFRYAVGAHASTGHRFGPVKLELDSSLERRSREKFYGIGNAREIVTPPEMLLDPAGDTAIVSQFSDDVVRHVGTIDVAIAGPLHTRLSGAWMNRTLGDSDDDQISQRYDTSRLVGFDTGVNNVYVEDELVIDTRRPSTELATQVLDGAGWLARAHYGVARGVDNDPTHFFRYGGEVQKFFDLYEGTHTLTLRALFDAVGGTDGRTDGRISFVDLPRLGGPEDLRGYPTGRFRDKAIALANVEYTWAIGDNASAYTFFDVGEPLASFDDAKDGRIRFGYGGGLQLHTRSTFLFRAQYGRSRDGDNAFNLVFSPAYGRRERAGRF